MPSTSIESMSLSLSQTGAAPPPGTQNAHRRAAAPSPAGRSRGHHHQGSTSGSGSFAAPPRPRVAFASLSDSRTSLDQPAVAAVAIPEAYTTSFSPHASSLPPPRPKIAPDAVLAASPSKNRRAKALIGACLAILIAVALGLTLLLLLVRIDRGDADATPVAGVPIPGAGNSTNNTAVATKTLVTTFGFWGHFWHRVVAGNASDLSMTIAQDECVIVQASAMQSCNAMNITLDDVGMHVTTVFYVSPSSGSGGGGGGGYPEVVVGQTDADAALRLLNAAQMRSFERTLALYRAVGSVTEEPRYVCPFEYARGGIAPEGPEDTRTTTTPAPVARLLSESTTVSPPSVRPGLLPLQMKAAPTDVSRGSSAPPTSNGIITMDIETSAPVSGPEEEVLLPPPMPVNRSTANDTTIAVKPLAAATSEVRSIKRPRRIL